MKTYACISIKGGVGKTAAAVNLAYASVEAGHRTLVWDLDPQGASTFHFRVKPAHKHLGRVLVRGEVQLDDCVRATEFERLDIVPADMTLRRFDAALEREKHPERWLSETLRTLEGDYDNVILDCAPGMTTVSECVFEAADALVIPTIPTPLSLRALAQLVKFLHANDERHYRALPFFSMVDRRKSLHRETCDWIHARQLAFLRTEIPYSSVIEQTGARREPVASFAPLSSAACAYRRLWCEIEERTLSHNAPSNGLPDAPNRLVSEQIAMWREQRAK